MKFEQAYQEAFSQVNVSEETKQEVLNMKKNENCGKSFGFRRAVVLAAAVLTLMAVTVTAFASEEIAGWVKTFFVAYSGELSDRQGELLAEKEQPILDSQTVDGWTVELKSAITDGNIGMLVFDLKGPEGTNAGKYDFGNVIKNLAATKEETVITWPGGIYQFRGWCTLILDDGDGLDNTKRIIMRLEPDKTLSPVDPFGPDAEYRIYFKDLYKDGKHDGKGNVVGELAAEGSWDFTVTFPQNTDEAMELLTEPVTVTGYFWNLTESEYSTMEAPVLLTSVELRNLTVTLYFETNGGNVLFSAPVENAPDIDPVVVLKDGRTIKLDSFGDSSSCKTYVAQAPIVLEEVDYLQMADGTVIPMPEITE